MTNTHRFDVFVSHAWEDKEEFVRPLVERLLELDITVWYDEFSLEIGDSLRESIDRGLDQCDYGVVVLSKAFFGKQWPARELDGLVDKAMNSGQKVVLPVWHDVTRDEVARFSHTLAGKVAAQSTDGVDEVAKQIARVVRGSSVSRGETHDADQGPDNTEDSAVIEAPLTPAALPDETRCLWPDSKLLRATLWVSLALSLVVLAYAVAFRYWEPPAYPPSADHQRIAGHTGELLLYRSYFEKLNWCLYPLFFVLVGIVLRFTWHPFQCAWGRAAGRDGPVAAADGSAVSAADVLLIKSKLRWLRRRLFPVAVLASMSWSYFDTAVTRSAFLGRSLSKQLAAALQDPDFTVKWLFEVELSAERVPPPLNQWIFYLLLEAEQLILIALGFMVLIQVGVQVMAFAVLDQLSFAQRRYRIHLQPRPSNDFGLGDWNRALDLFYWLVSVALIISIVSSRSQPDADKDIGQLLGSWALGILLCLPFLVTVAGRQRWLHQCRARLEEQGEKADWESFHVQRLWPTDPKRMEKIGALLCLVLYLVFLYWR